MEIAKGYIDVDKFEFMVTDCAPGDALCGGPSFNCEDFPDDPACLVSIPTTTPSPKLQHFTVFDVKGSVITRVDNYTIEGATASLRLNPGVYLIKSDTEIKKFVK